MPNPNGRCCRTFLRSMGEPERIASNFVAVISHCQCRLQLKLWCSDLGWSRQDEPESRDQRGATPFKERSRRTVSNVIEPIQTRDILDRAVVSWVGTAAGPSVEMSGDALVDDPQGELHPVPKNRVRCFMEQEVRHGEKAVYAGVQA